MPFCPQCGVDNPAAARFCDQCGAMLIPVGAPAAPAAPPSYSSPSAPTVAAQPPAQPLVSGSVTCPQCGTPAIPGEAFCDNCGASLSAPPRPVAPAPVPPYSSNVPPQPSYPPPQPSSSPPVQRLTPSTASTPPAPPISQAPPAGARSTLAPARLIVAATGAVLTLPASPQAIVGRGDPVSNFFPEVDLTPHGALDQGVGRRHLRLFVLGAQVMVEDLDSTNGTQINGQRLAPRQPQPLRSGDTLIVGKLALRFQE